MMQSALVANGTKETQMRKQFPLTYELANQYFNYDELSGDIFWKISRQGHVKAGDLAGAMGKHYRYIYIFGKNYLAHRLAWLLYYKTWPENQIDHLNGIKTDNRISNLQDVTKSENMQNTKSKGYFLNKNNGLYVAQINANNRHYSLGSYKTTKEARSAYLSAKKILKFHNSNNLMVENFNENILTTINGLYRTNTSGQKNISIRTRSGKQEYLSLIHI